MKVQFKNTITGEIVQIKVGWSWTLFFFSSFLGIPLFLRKLHVWGGVFLALWAINLIFASVEPAMLLILQLVFIGLSIWLGIKGNEMTAKNLLEKGYEFVDPDSDLAKYAKGKWGLPR